MRDRVAGIIKRYVTKLMERMKKPCREYRPGKDIPRRHRSSLECWNEFIQRFNFQSRIERSENNFQRFSTICFDEMPRERKSGSLARSRMARSNNKWLGKHLTAARKYVPGENVLFQSSRVGRIKAERKVFNARSPT